MRRGSELPGVRRFEKARVSENVRVFENMRRVQNFEPFITSLLAGFHGFGCFRRSRFCDKNRVGHVFLCVKTAMGER